MMHWILIGKANTIDWHFAYSKADYSLEMASMIIHIFIVRAYHKNLSKNHEMTLNYKMHSK